MKTKAILSSSALVLVLLHPAAGQDPSLSVGARYTDFSADPIILNLGVSQDTTSSSLQRSASTSHGNIDASSSYGGISASANNFATGGHGGNDFTASGSFHDIITINPGDSALLGATGVARFTFTVGGSMTMGDINSGDTTARWNASMSVTGFVGSSARFSGYYGNGSSGSNVFGRLPGSVGTVTFDEPFRFGQTIGVTAGGGVQVGSSFSNPGANASITISGGRYQILYNGAAANYSATSSTGAAAGTNVTSGNSFSGISLTNSGIASHGTTASLIGGAATADRAVNLGFIAGVPTDGSILGDVVNVTGLGSTLGAATDLFVMNETYDPAAAIAMFGSVDGLLIKWYDAISGSWKLGTDGNFGGTPTFKLGAFDPLTDLLLGHYGLDTADNSVWGVFNHNSEFAVGNFSSVPEPTTLFTGVFCAVACASIRRRRRF